MADFPHRRLASSGAVFETQIGFSRAARIGAHVAISGTAPLNADGSTAFPGDLYQQTRRSLAISLEALAKLGARPEDVLRTRILLTDISRWLEAARAHGEVFAEIRPACTFVEVSRFIGEDWLVETEVDAVVSVE